MTAHTTLFTGVVKGAVILRTSVQSHAAEITSWQLNMNTYCAAQHEDSCTGIACSQTLSTVSSPLYSPRRSCPQRQQLPRRTK